MDLMDGVGEDGEKGVWGLGFVLFWFSYKIRLEGGLGRVTRMKSLISWRVFQREEGDYSSAIQPKSCPAVLVFPSVCELMCFVLDTPPPPHQTVK